ncbi:metal-dependent transcriptional regulator [Puniceicoccales bacterium CK1056]|uniref:Metal-dependent transcriptional regulator n=1 Tax=Oceanipulchritudo coccoides TaxID=2706888 RepID=A0A6B2M3Y0_9BACT|nr:metal-dependent transcriptional regulator [Oceanipulchritudo coccoides]NDV62929.1 metal-dependent transcriptional regulator [Oceanipulchritudo coccoides]
MKKGLFKREEAAALRAEHFLKRASSMWKAGDDIDLRKTSADLELTLDEVLPILPLMEQAGYMESAGEQWRLTQAGWEHGRNLLRAHRVYESYLAEETGLHPGEWHEEADRAEHELDPETVNKMAQALNRPRYDPHGDAIPTRWLDMPEQEGQLLTRVEKDGFYRINHIEDEPREPFEHLIQTGMVPGLMIEVQILTGGRFLVKWAGQETVLDSASAAALLVTECDPETGKGLPGGVLEDTADGAGVTIHSLSPAIRGLERRRLLDLGFVPGSTVVREGSGPFSGPARFRVRGTIQALRPEQTRNIFIQEENA